MCRKCFGRREAKKVCSDCGSPYDDPAVEDDFSGRCKSRYVARGTRKYLCSWCALTRGADNDYIRKRIGENLTEKKMDVAKLRIVKKGETVFPTEKDFDVLNDFEWYRERVKGEEFGKKWRDYYVLYDGYVIGTFDKPMTVEEVNEGLMPNPYFLILDPDDTRKLIRVYRVRVFYRYTLAFLQIYFEKSSPDLDLIHIENLSEDELMKVWGARGLFIKVKSTRPRKAQRVINLPSKARTGRRPKINLPLNALISLVACLRELDRGSLIDKNQTTQYDVLTIINVDRATLFRHIKNRLKTDWQTIVDRSESLNVEDCA